MLQDKNGSKALPLKAALLLFLSVIIASRVESAIHKPSILLGHFLGFIAKLHKSKHAFLCTISSYSFYLSVR